MKVLTSLGCLTLAVALGLASGPARALEPAGTVAEIEGSAQATHTDGQSEALALNATVYVGDRIATGPRSRVSLLLQDDSLLTLAPGTKLEINELVYKPQQSLRRSVFSLVQGSMMAVVGGWFSSSVEEAQWEVRPPTAVAGVRGSSLVADVQNTGGRSTSTVASLGGLIGVQALVDPTGKIVLLQPNYFTVVPQGGLPSDAQMLDADMLQELLNSLIFSQSALDQRGDQFRNTQGLQATTIYLTPEALASLLGVVLSQGTTHWEDPSQVIFQEPAPLTPVSIRVVMP